MTLKAKLGIAIPAVAVVVALLPTPMMDAIYNSVYMEGFPVVSWVLPIIVAIISFLLLSDVIKALIAGAVSYGMTMLMFGFMGIAGGDCAQAGVPLSKACYADAAGSLMFAKIGLAGLICLNLFLLWRLAYPKVPKTVQKTR